ncbi:hypothetical protein GCM10010174_36970 [Kutzneria viridogrisea]|uniref:Transposase n=2 Tax=Kutzneria TaxID=43356 RepID=W5W987_9PSEU|nr:transposase [Kutzneria albida]AHH94749.1 hypothetical protein KALB_1376 [Kutzneria albida DSM 43870]MBA8930418.1 transposase-like protein [Kutzneria viridogrisea]
MANSYPPEFRWKVLALVASGRPVVKVAAEFGISDQTIYNWRRQHLADSGQLPSVASSTRPELAAALDQITELEAELANRRRAAQLLAMSPPRSA